MISYVPNILYVIFIIDYMNKGALSKETVKGLSRTFQNFGLSKNVAEIMFLKN